MLKKKVLLFLMLACCHYCIGQKTYSISLEDSGKIRPTMPERLFSNDKLRFRVDDAVESFDTYKKNLTDKAARGKRQLKNLKADTLKMAVLNQVYGITLDDINNVLSELDAVLAYPSGSAGTYLPHYSAGDELYYNVELSNVATPTKIPMGVNIESGPLAITPATGKTEIGFTVLKKDPFKKLVYNWLENTKNDYEKVQVDTSELKAIVAKSKLYPATVQVFIDKIDRLAEADKAIRDTANKRLYSLPVLTQLVNEGDLLRSEMEATKRAFDQKMPKNDKDWILKWLWYQNSAMPSLNPFNFIREEDLGDEPDTSKLESIRLKILAREEFYKKVDPAKFRISLIDSLINETDSIKNVKFKLEKAVSRYTKIKKENDKAIQDFGTTARQLNEGLVVVTNETDGLIYWMRHHDASTGYQLINDEETGEYLETDRVVILSHNLRRGEKTELHITYTDIANDMSLIAENASPLIAQLQKAITGLGLKADVPFANTAAIKELRIKLDGILAAIRSRLREFQFYPASVSYLLAQTNPKIDIKETVDKTRSYHSQVANPPKKLKGPKKATYYMNTVTDAKEPASGTVGQKTVADTFSYRVNKLYRFFPMAGINYTVNRFNEITAGGSGQTKNTEDAHVHFMVGLKVFLKKIDIRSPKFFTGKDEHGNRLLLSRISLQAGFDAQKPLRNVYGGAGLDLWPGFCISVGAVANKYTYNVYNNGQAVQSKNLSRAGFYAGISTDISLFTDIAKFLNISK